MKKITLFFSIFLMLSSLSAQSLYDETVVQEIEIFFTASNWDALLDAEMATTEDYIMADSVIVNGVVFDSVGVKYKGNSTYSANQTKNPFHIELDTYKEQDYDGYKDIKLSNVLNDPSFLREVLSYKVIRNYMDAPLSNYANVTVNGSLIGLYVSSEAVSKTFLKSRFDSNDNTFVKCNPIDGAVQGSSDIPNLVYLGTDSANYDEAYEMKSDNGWSDLINLCDTLENNLTDIEEILDVDRALWMLALDNVLVNFDSYIGVFSQNYYLYQDDYGRFLPIIWDLNESFGQFSDTGSGTINGTTSAQQIDHLLHDNDADFPLISQLLSVPTYKKMYLAHYKTILTDNFTNNGLYYTEGLAFQSTADASVQADPNKFYTYNNFIDNLTSDVTENSSGGPGGGGPGSTFIGITSLMNGRYSYLMNLNDFTNTQPTISNIEVSNSTPSLGDVLTFTCNVIDEDEVYFRYREAEHAPFEKVQMFDDGAHNDGAANDDVYGVDVTINSSLMQYYFYAENSNIGKFSPTNAEHEFYELTAEYNTTGDIVINEFLASNDEIQDDQDGEYDDWIEIYNKGSVTVDISGYTLSDDATDFSLFVFPSGTTIAADEYIIVWADKDLTQNGYHADFKLSASGESIILTDASFNILDMVDFGEQETDISYGRYPNGTGSFEDMTPTFAAENKQSTTTSIVEVDEEESILSIYPNPAKNSVTVQLSSAVDEDSFVKIFDTKGQMMFHAAIDEKVAINTSSWSAGLYFVLVGDKTEKLIIK